MTSLDALHTAHIASLKGDRQLIIDYIAKNAGLLLAYYEGQSDDEELLHNWCMSNNPHYTKVIQLRSGRCADCGAKIPSNDEACSRCGTAMSSGSFQLDEPSYEQRSDCQSGGYKRAGFLAGHLAKMQLNLPPDLQTKIFNEFKRVETVFQAVKKTSSRRNMLPYKMVIKKLLERLGRTDIADLISYSASYENLLQQEACWEEIAASL